MSQKRHAVVGGAHCLRSRFVCTKATGMVDCTKATRAPHSRGRSCSVQYMQQPEKVFAEIYRVLKPGGVCIVTFSNRLFYDKAIAAWREGTGYSRCQLVRSYFQAVEGFTEPEVIKEVRSFIRATSVARLDGTTCRCTEHPDVNSTLLGWPCWVLDQGCLPAHA
jgi:SAM-dependent methyltransferase